MKSTVSYHEIEVQSLYEKNSAEANKRLIEVVAEIKEYQKSFSHSNKTCYLEINIHLQYILNILNTTKSSFSDQIDFITLRNQLEQANRFIATIGEIDGLSSDIHEELTRTLSEKIHHCLIPVDEQITFGSLRFEEYQKKTDQFMHQFVLFMSDDLANGALRTILSKIKKHLEKNDIRISCYLSYAWPSPRFRLQESNIQAFLSQVHQHLRSAGIHSVIDILDNENQLITDFTNEADKCQFVLLTGTPSLRDKLSDPYWRIDKLSQHQVLQQVIPFRLIGTPLDTFSAYQQEFTVAGDWRDDSYIFQLKRILSQLLSAAISMEEYEECWESESEHLKRYSINPSTLGSPDKSRIALYFAEQQSQLEQLTSYKHVKTQRSNEILYLKLSNQSESSPVSQNESFNGSFQLPLPFEDFTGREAELNKLSKFENQSMVVISQGKNISGSGGVGKTVLASMFANRQRAINQITSQSGYSSVIWFHAGTDDFHNSTGLLAIQFSTLAKQLRIDTEIFTGDDLYQQVYKKLAQRDGKCLVVFDNVLKIKPITPFLPNDKAFHILITTRNSNQNDWPTEFDPVILSVFTLEDAVAYARKFLKRNGSLFDEDDNIVNLVEILGRFPLALTQALSYICENALSIKDFICEFDVKKQSLLDIPSINDPYVKEKSAHSDFTSHQVTVWTTVQLALSKLKGDTCKQVFHACAYLASEVPIDVMMLYCFTQDPFSGDKAIRELRRYGLLKNASIENHIEVHNLIREILRASDSIDQSVDYLKAIRIVIMHHFFYTENPLRNETRKKRLLPHLQECIRLFEKYGKDQNDIKIHFLVPLKVMLASTYSLLGESLKELSLYESILPIINSDDTLLPVKAEILHNMSLSCMNVDDYDRATELLNTAYQLFKNQSDTPPSSICTVLCTLGSLNRVGGQLEAAKHFLEEALRMAEILYGDDNIQIVNILNNLGNVYCQQNDLLTGIRFLERALAIKKATYGEEHPLVASTLNGLGGAFLKLGKLKLAKSLIEESYRINLKFYGKAHLSVIYNELNLSSLSIEDGDSLSAKKYINSAIESSKSLLTIDSPKRLELLHKLGETLSDLGEYNDAEKQLLLALELVEKKYGPHHIKVTEALFLLANVSEDIGEFEKAKERYERVWGIQKLAFGESNTTVIKTAIRLADTYNSLGDIERAKKLLINTYKTIEASQAENQHNITEINFALAKNYLSLAESGKALDILEKLLKSEEKKYGESPGKFEAIFTNIGCCHLDLGNYDLAKRFHQKALDILEKKFGKFHVNVAYQLSNCGNAHFSSGETKKAFELHSRALKILEHAYGKDSFQIASTLHNIASCYNTLGHSNEAREILERALKLLIKAHSENHPQVAKTLNSLAATCFYLKLPELQIKYLRDALVILKRVYGTEHVEYALVETNLGAALLHQPHIAKDHLTHALQIYEKEYGSNSAKVGDVLSNLGNAYKNLEEFDRALGVFNRAMPILVKHYGPQSRQVGMVIYSIGTVHSCQGDLDKALECYLQTLNIEEAAYGPGHIEIATTLRSIGNIHLRKKNYSQAEVYYQKNLKIIESFFPQGHPEISSAKFMLAYVYKGLNNLKRACDILLDCIKSFNTTLGPRHPKTMEATEMLANIQAKLSSTPALSNEEPTQSQDMGQVIRRITVLGTLKELEDVLVLHHSDIDKQDSNKTKGYTALHLAVIKNRAPQVECLLSHHAKFDIIDIEKCTAMDYLLRSGNVELIEIFKKAVCLRYSENILDETQLPKIARLCANSCDKESLKLLIFLKTDIDQPGPSTGQTALHRAVVKGYTDCVRLLLGAGAQPHTLDKNGKRPADLTNDPTILELLSVNPILII